jgi:hypothetical protein
MVQQAILYCIFNKANIDDNKVTNDFFEKNKDYFRDYSLHLDDEVKQYISHWKGDYNAWRKELTALKEETLNSILQKVKGVEYLSSANAADLVELAKAMGALLAVDLKTSQIRRFLGAVMGAEAEVEAKKKVQMISIKPRLSILKFIWLMRQGAMRRPCRFCAS